MTEIQFWHHIEQMEALRRDFLHHWETKLMPTAIRCGYADALMTLQHGAWEQWKREHRERGVAP